MKRNRDTEKELHDRLKKLDMKNQKECFNLENEYNEYFRSISESDFDMYVAEYGFFDSLHMICEGYRILSKK